MLLTEAITQLLRLPDAFEKEDPNHGYEWTAEMININYGHNEELLNSCKLLKDYSYFVQKVREYSCDMDRHDAIVKAIDECIKADIFKEVLQKYREEAIRNTIAAMRDANIDNETIRA